MDQEKRKEIIESTNMVIKLCLIAGSSLTTAYKIGSLFASGLEDKFDPCICEEFTPPASGRLCRVCNKPRRKESS